MFTRVLFTEKDWFVRYSRAARDMHLAHAFAYCVMEQQAGLDELMLRAYQTALVVTYCRPFADVEDRPTIPQEELPYRRDDHALHRRMLFAKEALWADKNDCELSEAIFVEEDLRRLMLMIQRAESHFELSRLTHRHQMEARGEVFDWDRY